MKLRILIEQDEEGQFVAICPTLPGCISQGVTRQEARTNIIDAIKGYLASLAKHDEPIPPPITEEIELQSDGESGSGCLILSHGRLVIDPRTAGDEIRPFAKSEVDL